MKVVFGKINLTTVCWMNSGEEKLKSGRPGYFNSLGKN